MDTPTCPTAGPDVTALEAGNTLAETAGKASVDVQTVRAWIHKGVSVAGRRVKLAAIRVGGRWRVTPSALAKFLSDCNPQAPTFANPTAEHRRRKAARVALLAKLRGEA